MQCSFAIKAFIAGGILLGMTTLCLVSPTRATSARWTETDAVASAKAKDVFFKKIDEVSGIAVAGFRDDDGAPLLWAHNGRVDRISLLRTEPDKPILAGELTMPGRKTRDAEDIATVSDGGKGTIYLEDAGANRKDIPACVRFARQGGGQCAIVDSYLVRDQGKDRRAQSDPRQACQARGKDWLWLSETTRFEPGAHPAIRRIPEPSYREVQGGKLAMATEVIEFDYPAQCGALPCGTVPGNRLEQVDAAYDVESLAVVVEPDHSHTAYLFTKSSHSLAQTLQKQRPDAPGCRFASDGLSDVFRLRHLDALAPGTVHRAEYVTTLDFSRTVPAREAAAERINAASFRKLSDHQGLLLVKTTEHAYKWPVALGKAAPAGASPLFDVAAALREHQPIQARLPDVNRKAGLARQQQEAVDQFDANTLFYMGECKGMKRCSIAKVVDNHPYLAGDVNGDGRIDRHDLAGLRAALAGRDALYCQAAADVDGDLHVGASDVAHLQAYLHRHGPAPVPRKAGETGLQALGCGYYPDAAITRGHRLPPQG